MINWDKSAELNNCTVDELKARFEKYPKSHKEVWWICDGGCGTEGVREFSAHNNLCKKCGNNTIETIEKRSKSASNRWSDSKNREDMSDRLKQYNIDHPEAGKERSKMLKQFYNDNPEYRETARLKTLQYHKEHPGAGKEHSDRLKNSDAMKIAIENQIGGSDIVMHHYLYDDADLSKYIMPMARSEHGMMHARMRADGYEVKHINSDTDDNGLWGYK